MSGPKKDRLAELRAAVGQHIKPVTASPAPQNEPGKGRGVEKKAPHTRSTMPAQAVPEIPARSGRGMQFYLDDTDRKTIHSLAVWFGSQDRRVSDSQVIKTAVRFASIQPNARLLEICDEVRAADRRLQKSRPAKSTQKP